MKGTILILDDDEDIRDILKDIFESIEFKVVCFSSIGDARKYLNDAANISQLKAIVSDLMLGYESGLDFLKEVRANSILNSVDFYLLTGASRQTFEPYIKSHQLKGIIEKPFDTFQLIETFANHSSKV